MRYRDKGQEIDPKTVDFGRTRISKKQISMDICEYSLVIAFNNGRESIRFSEISDGNYVYNFLQRLRMSSF